MMWWFWGFITGVGFGVMVMRLIWLRVSIQAVKRPKVSENTALYSDEFARVRGVGIVDITSDGLYRLDWSPERQCWVSKRIGPPLPRSVS